MTPPGRGRPTIRHDSSLGSQHRLRRSADFEAVFRDGRRSRDSLFTVLYRPSGLAYARLGMATPARRVRRAVLRNRLRRLIRESFRHRKQELRGLDIVVLVDQHAAAAASRRVFLSLDGHWDRLRKYPGDS